MKKTGVTHREDYSDITYMLGILSIVLAFFTPLVSLILGIIGINLGKKQKTSISEKGYKLSKIGIIISIIILVIIIAISIIYGSDKMSNFPIA